MKKKILAYLLAVCVCWGIVGRYDVKICNAAEEKVAYETTYSKVKTFQDINGKVYAQSIVGVTNTGTCTLYLGPSRYDLEDENGLQILSESNIECYPSIVEPGETGYYYDICRVKKVNTVQELNIIMSYEWVDSASGCVYTAIKESDDKRKDLDIVETKHYDSENGKSIVYKCTVKATDRGTLYIPKVAAIFFDEDGDPITVMRGIYYNPNNQKQVRMEYYLSIDVLLDSMTIIPNDITIDRDTDYIVYAYA